MALVTTSTTTEGTTSKLVSLTLAEQQSCKLPHGRSIRPTSPKSIARYNQTVDGESHKLAGIGSIPICATISFRHEHRPIGRVFIDASGIPANPGRQNQQSR